LKEITSLKFNGYFFVVNQAQVVTLYQPILQAISLRILGSISDAEDAVQDAILKWLTIDTGKVENAKSYLISMVTNASLNMLKQRKSLNNIDAQLVSDELEDQDKQNSLFHFDIENQITEAWNFLHRKLEPVERAAFVLREVFDMEYEDLQFVVDRKAENCRKIVSRAKEKLRNTELPKVKITLPDPKMMDNLKAAFNKGYLSPLVHDFSIDLFRKKK